MVIEVSQVLERLLTNEFVVFVELCMWLARAFGLVLFIKGVFMWRAYTLSRAGTPMISQMLSTNSNPKWILNTFIASAFLWQFGEGIATISQWLYMSNTTAFDSPYSSEMFDSISYQSSYLVNFQSMNIEQKPLKIGIRFALAIFSLYGLYSYLKGLIYLSSYGDPYKNDLSFKTIAVHIIIGNILIYTNMFYTMLSSTYSASAA